MVEINKFTLDSGDQVSGEKKLTELIEKAKESTEPGLARQRLIREIVDNFWVGVNMDNLRWTEREILKDLRENHVKVEENVEMMWYKWRKVYIDLPSVWNFWWFKFGYFVSDDWCSRSEFESNQELKERSYSVEDVSWLFKAVNEYMKELSIETDWDMNYKTDLWQKKTNKRNCFAWNYLKNIAGLDDVYWLNDEEKEKNLRAFWNCIDNACFFDRRLWNFYGGGKLLLMLSD